MIEKEKYRLFIIINGSLVFLCIVFLFIFLNGEKNEMPWDIIAIGFATAIPIVLVQYPILLLRKNWFYKLLIFYLSMVVFLFLLGGIISWNEAVGSNAAGTWLARMDAGIGMVLIGQVFGGLFGFVLILTVNYLYKEKLFN